MAITTAVRLRNSIIKSMFVDTADTNYIVARWAFFHGLYREHFWSAAQAIEKYLKACLVLNGVSVKPYGHDIVRLFLEAREIADDFIIREFDKHSAVKLSFWAPQEPIDFIREIAYNGNPDNRYGHHGIVNMTQQLFQLDQIVFSLRRVSVPLDLDFDDEPPAPHKNWRAWLSADPKYQPREKIKLPIGVRGKQLDDIEGVVYHLNFPFGEVASDRISTFDTISMERSYLELTLDEFIYDENWGEDAVAAVNWLIENVKFTKEDERNIRQLIRQRTVSSCGSK